MNFAEAMDEIAAELETISGLRVYPFPPDNVQVPAAVVDLPESIEYDGTYGRGSDTMVIPVTVLVGKVSDRASRDAIAPYCSGSGTSSVKAVVEAGTYTAFDAESLRVRAADEPFEVWTFAGVAYLGAAFRIDLTGQGA